MNEDIDGRWFHFPMPDKPLSKPKTKSEMGKGGMMRRGMGRGQGHGQGRGRVRPWRGSRWENPA